MNPYDFNPYSPFSNDMLQCTGMYEPEKIVMRQLDKKCSSLPDQLSLKTFRRPKIYNERQYFAPGMRTPGIITSTTDDYDDFFTWFTQSVDFYVVLLFILIVIVVNFIVASTNLSATVTDIRPAPVTSS
jgi:hypothetical protein